jgi:hypothetical protein
VVTRNFLLLIANKQISVLVNKYSFRSAASPCALPTVTLFVRRKCESMMASLKQSALLSVFLLTVLSTYQNLSVVQATEHGKKSLQFLLLSIC